MVLPEKPQCSGRVKTAMGIVPHQLGYPRQILSAATTDLPLLILGYLPYSTAFFDGEFQI